MRARRLERLEHGRHLRIAVQPPIGVEQLGPAAPCRRREPCARRNRAPARSVARNRRRRPSASAPRNIPVAWRARSPTGAGRPARSGRHDGARRHGRRTACRKRRKRKPRGASVTVCAARQGQAQARIASRRPLASTNLRPSSVDGSTPKHLPMARQDSFEKRNQAMTLATAAQSATWTYRRRRLARGQRRHSGPAQACHVARLQRVRRRPLVRGRRARPRPALPRGSTPRRSRWASSRP